MEEKSAELEDLKNLIISATGEAVEEALANAPFSPEKHYELVKFKRRAGKKLFLPSWDKTVPSS